MRGTSDGKKSALKTAHQHKCHANRIQTTTLAPLRAIAKFHNLQICIRKSLCECFSHFKSSSHFAYRFTSSRRVDVCFLFFLSLAPIVLTRSLLSHTFSFATTFFLSSHSTLASVCVCVQKKSFPVCLRKKNERRVQQKPKTNRKRFI